MQRIITLLPAACEIVCLLGLRKSLVGISSDCDYPLNITPLPKITHTAISQELSSSAIDQYVKHAKHHGQSVFHIDQTLLQKLKPDLILTQELCSVCAPSYKEIQRAAKVIDGICNIVSLEPHTVEDIFENIKTVGSYTNTKQHAADIIASLKIRIKHIQKILDKKMHEPSVVILEWMKPLMIAGHWVPEMVDLAGGDMLFAKTGEKSKHIVWEKIVTANPDILIIAPCGFDIQRTKNEVHLITSQPQYKDLAAVKNKNIFFIDANVYLTRPGPRVVDGIEILAEIFHPRLFPRKHAQTDWQNIFL